MPDFDGVHDLDDVGSLLEHNSIDCGQPMLMPFQLTSATHTKPQNTDAFTPRLSPLPPLSLSLVSITFNQKTDCGLPNTFHFSFDKIQFNGFIDIWFILTNGMDTRLWLF